MKYGGLSGCHVCSPEILCFLIETIREELDFFCVSVAIHQFPSTFRLLGSSDCKLPSNSLNLNAKFEFHMFSFLWFSLVLQRRSTHAKLELLRFFSTPDLESHMPFGPQLAG